MLVLDSMWHYILCKFVILWNMWYFLCQSVFIWFGRQNIITDVKNILHIYTDKYYKKKFYHHIKSKCIYYKIILYTSIYNNIWLKHYWHIRTMTRKMINIFNKWCLWIYYVLRVRKIVFSEQNPHDSVHYKFLFLIFFQLLYHKPVNM